MKFEYKKNGQGNHKYHYGSYEDFYVEIRKDHIDTSMFSEKPEQTYFIEIKYGGDSARHPNVPLWYEVYDNAPNIIRHYRTRETLKDAKNLAENLLNEMLNKLLNKQQFKNWIYATYKTNSIECDDWRNKNNVWNEESIKQIAFF